MMAGPARRLPISTESFAHSCNSHCEALYCRLDYQRVVAAKAGALPSTWSRFADPRDHVRFDSTLLAPSSRYDCAFAARDSLLAATLECKSGG